MKNTIQRQYESFVGEITSYLETLLFKPIMVRASRSEYGKTRGILLKYVAIPFKDELQETPHISFSLFLYAYQELEEIDHLKTKDYSTLENTLILPFEPVTDVLGLDKPEKTKEEKIQELYDYPTEKIEGTSCTGCTLDIICRIKRGVRDLFLDIPVRLYHKRQSVWSNILKEIGKNCPHFNPIKEKTVRDEENDCY